jgi:hypothetical protein
MDYNNWNHYARERAAELRGERSHVERWFALGRRGFRVDFLKWFKSNGKQLERKTNYQ